MQTYYFTFRQVDRTLQDEPMKDYWVEVSASNWVVARDKFCQLFALPIMGAMDKWAFQYEKEFFNPNHFPKGLYARIE